MKRLFLYLIAVLLYKVPPPSAGTYSRARAA
jgi:hypothetical protein